MNNKNRFLDENKFLLSMLVVVLLLAIIAYLGSRWDDAKLRERESRFISGLKQSTDTPEELATRLEIELRDANTAQYGIELLRHLSLAFTISFITILAVEFHTRTQMRKDFQEHMEAVKQNVWEALGKRLLGSRIAVQVEAIMKEDAAKKDASYVITFKPPRDGIPDDRVIVVIENTYKLRNLTGVTGRTHRIYSNLSNYEELGDLPKFTKFLVNGQPQEVSQYSTTTTDTRSISKVVILPEAENEYVDVVLGMELVYQTRDTESFVTSIPVEGMQINVGNQVPERVGAITVDMSIGVAEHPLDGFWKVDRAILPGQGFSLSWKDVRTRGNVVAASSTESILLASTSSAKEIRKG
jgi:hypothetical protein